LVKYLAATVYRAMIELNSYLTYIRLRIKPFNKIDSRFWVGKFENRFKYSKKCKEGNVRKS